MTAENWTRLHDATLESLELLWPSGNVELRIRTGDSTHPLRLVAASAVRRIGCERRMPWGPSASINEVRGPAVADDGTSVLEIEMQSGDLLRIEAGAFTLRDTE